MNPIPERLHGVRLGAAFKEILAAMLISGILIAVLAFYFRSLYDATQVVCGELFAVFNILFYSMAGWMIFVKKNVAWIVLVTVIKYALLMIAVYIVWAHGQVLLVALGMLLELVLTALFWLLLKVALFKRTENEPL